MTTVKVNCNFKKLGQLFQVKLPCCGKMTKKNPSCFTFPLIKKINGIFLQYKYIALQKVCENT